MNSVDSNIPLLDNAAFNTIHDALNMSIGVIGDVQVQVDEYEGYRKCAIVLLFIHD